MEFPAAFVSSSERLREATTLRKIQLQGPSPSSLRTSLMFIALIISACSGGGHGDNTVTTPTAVVTPLNYKPISTASSNAVVINVRSGADVQLSGKDSSSGNISIVQFAWKQTDASPIPQVALLYRNSNTVSFNAPAVAQSVTLNFQLTIQNESGRTSTANAQVVVFPSNDSNRFLLTQPPRGGVPMPRHFRAGVSTLAGLQNLTADAPVCIQLARTVSYTARNGDPGSVVLPTQQVDAKWVASVGGSVTPGDYSNPVVSFTLPSLNDDDILAQYGGADVNGQPVSDVSPMSLVPSDVDSAYVQMAVSAAPGSCDGTVSNETLSAATLVLQLYDEQGYAVGSPATATAAGSAVTVNTSLAPLNPNPLTPDGSSHLTPDDFLRAEASRITATASLRNPFPAFETRESATAYYAAIDPAAAKTTLPAWLSANCFDPNDANYGEGEAGYDVTHAVYTNNYDLGFGRDMYFSTCPNGTMASVVINYPTLETAANKLGAFLAVAMEYTPAAGAGGSCFANVTSPPTTAPTCFATFYSFAPDDRTGVFKRILSANFDRRGQKYLPGSCTVCHGGTPAFAPGQPYPASGKTDANFLPWDVGTLLFGDTDPAFACAGTAQSQNPNCASINPTQYSKATQEPLIQKMNALAWKTYQFVENVSIPPPTIDRYQAPRDLLTQWYGGDPGAATAHAFDDSATPAAWMTPGQTASSTTDLYHTVFAHYCRSCHTEVSLPLLQFSTYAQFNTFLSAANPAGITQSVFSDAIMPLSRLTMDRFWEDFDGGTSAAQTLGTFANGSTAGLVAVDATNNVMGSGKPQITLLNPAAPPNTAVIPGTPVTVTAPGIALDAVSSSVFAANYQWSASLVSGSTTPVSCSNAAASGTAVGVVGTPLVLSGASTGAAEAGAAIPAFSTSAPGTYCLTLNVSDGALGATATPFVYQFVVN
jgi:hypothetical protein